MAVYKRVNSRSHDLILKNSAGRVGGGGLVCLLLVVVVVVFLTAFGSW